MVTDNNLKMSGECSDTWNSGDSWNTRKGEAARLKAMANEPEVVDELTETIIHELSETGSGIFKNAVKAVLAELVKMMEE